MNKPNRFSLTLITSLLLVSIPVSVFASAGKAIYVIGKVLAVSDSGNEQRIQRKDEIYQGDTIITNARSQIQIRMSDGTLLAVRPNSKFRIDSYIHKDDTDADKSHYNLLKGTFRSITGSIGQKNKRSYMVSTPVGTIGIRGTDFSARLCDGDCGDANDGLYVGVMQGEIVLNNDSGELNVVPGDFGYMQDQNIEPSQLENTPGDLLFAHTDTTTHTEIANNDTSNTENASYVELAESVESTTSTTEIVVASTTTNNDDLINTPVLDPIIDDTNPDPIADNTDPVNTDIVLPSSGTATYAYLDHTPIIPETDDLYLNTADTILAVNFVDPSADVTISVNELASGIADDIWVSTSNTMDINADGTFAGVLTGDSNYGGSGNVSGSLNLAGTAEATIGAPSDASLSYDMNDGGTLAVSGDINFQIGTTTP